MAFMLLFFSSLDDGNETIDCAEDIIISLLLNGKKIRFSYWCNDGRTSEFYFFIIFFPFLAVGLALAGLNTFHKPMSALFVFI